MRILAWLFVALVGEREKHKLDEDGHYKNDDAVVAYKRAEEIEDRYHNPGVDPSEHRPAERNEAGEAEVFIAHCLMVKLTREADKGSGR